MRRPVRLRLLRTRYPHWGQHSGFYQFARYLDRQQFHATMREVTDGDDDFPVPGAELRKFLRRRVQRHGMAWYKLSDLAAELDTMRACLANRVDIVHYLDGEHTAQYLPVLLRKMRLSRIRTIATYHQPAELLDGLIRREIVARLDGVTLVSPEQQDFFREFLPPERISVVLHGIDTEYFRPSETNRDDGRIRCITTGRWMRDWTAVRAVAARLRDRRDIEFHIVSNAQTGLEDCGNVTIHKNVSDGALLSLYQGAHVLFLPLSGATANNSLLEGLACGLPVVSTALPSVLAYVGADDAVLVGGNDPEELTHAVLRLAGDPDERGRLGLRARSRALELDWRRIAPQFQAVYFRLVTPR